MFISHPIKVAKMVSSHKQTEWSDATPAGNGLASLLQVGFGHVGLAIVVALVLGVLSSLLLMLPLGGSVVCTLTTGGGLETGSNGPS